MAATPPDAVLHWPAKYNEVPKEVFQREDVYRRELRRIFYGPVWHPVAHIAEIPHPGDFKTFVIGEAPVIVIHGDDGKIRVFFNSCPHRGTQLQTCARGSGTGIECPYHRWTFSNNGDLLGAAGMNRFSPEFRKEDYGLRQVRSDTIAGVIFACCDPDGPSLRAFLGQAADHFGAALGGDVPLVLLGYQKVVFSANWKEYADNDGYHAPLLHRAFRLLRWQGGGGTQLVSEYGHRVTDAQLHDNPDTGYLHDHSLMEFRDPNAPRRSTVIALFPLTVITKHLDVISLRLAFPRSQDETEVHYSYFCRTDDDEDMRRHRLRQASNLLGPSGLISLEDGAVFNRLHAASTSPGAAAFQKGVNGRIEAPCHVDQNDEASNLVRWEKYREIMGFDRD